MDNEQDPVEGQDGDSAFTDAMGNQQSPEPQPPAPQPNAAVASQQEPASPEPSDIALGELMVAAKDAGFDFGDQEINSEGDFARIALEQLRQNQPMVNFANQLAPHADKVSELLLGDKGAGEPPPPATEAAADEWNADEYFSTKYGGALRSAEHEKAIGQGMVNQNPSTGMWEPSRGFEVIGSRFANELNAIDSHRASFWNDLSNSNPYQSFYGVLKEPIMREVQGLVAKELSTREQQSQENDVISAYENENASWMFTQDASGNRNFSESGKVFADQFSRLLSSGITDHGVALEIAEKLVKPQQPPAPTQPEPSKSFLEQAVNRAQHSSPVSESPATPMPLTDDEHQTLFTRALAGRKSG